ncbi:hypothetical protein ACIPSA_17080 [Streptomyces sp. NPDC086549]|uniref:hypothetical protein n=1 Tax=Streptomyces sp. NPDC086549 TaxID=3365752 RepID=UPI003814BBC7
MAIPNEDRLEVLCRNDMNDVNKSVQAIQDAIKQVNGMLPHTWVGKDADNWCTEYNGRIGQLNALFSMNLPPEETRLIEKAKKDQQAMDKKSHGGHG